MCLLLAVVFNLMFRCFRYLLSVLKSIFVMGGVQFQIHEAPSSLVSPRSLLEDPEPDCRLEGLCNEQKFALQHIE